MKRLKTKNALHAQNFVSIKIRNLALILCKSTEPVYSPSPYRYRTENNAQVWFTFLISAFFKDDVTLLVEFVW